MSTYKLIKLKNYEQHLLFWYFQLHQQMENANYESEASILSAEQIQEIVQRKVSPLFMPK